MEESTPQRRRIEEASYPAGGEPLEANAEPEDSDAYLFGKSIGTQSQGNREEALLAALQKMEENFAELRALTRGITDQRSTVQDQADAGASSSVKDAMLAEQAAALVAALRKMEQDCTELQTAAREMAAYRRMLEEAERRITVLESAFEGLVRVVNARSTGSTAAPAPNHGASRWPQPRLAQTATGQSASARPGLIGRSPVAVGASEPKQALDLGGGEPEAGPTRRQMKSGEIFVFDIGGTAEDIRAQLGAWGQNAVHVDPDPNLGIDLNGRSVSAAAVNLALPSAWGAIRRLCSATGSTNGPVIAYAQSPGSVRAFWLGPVQFAILPLDDSDVSEIFRRGAPDAHRVLACSSDVDLMNQVRRELGSGNVSASVALDYRQAVDMIPIVRPEAALVHLIAGSEAPFRVLSELRKTKSSENMPLVLVLDTAAQPKDAAFFSAAMSRLASRGPLATADLIRSCARCVSQLAVQQIEAPT